MVLHENRQEILSQLIQQINPYATFEADTLLLQEGVLDSLGVMTLITLIEERFNIIIADDDVAAKNFQSLSAIETLLSSYC